LNDNGSPKEPQEPPRDIDESASAQKQPEAPAKLLLVGATHGADCHCDITTTLVNLPLAHSDRVELARAFKRLPERLTLWEMVAGSMMLSEYLRSALFQAIEIATQGECPYHSSAASTPWTHRRLIGPQAVDDRWPDDLDSGEWATILDGGARTRTASGPSLEALTAAPRIDDLISPRPRGARDLAEIRLASSPWEWVEETPAEYQVDPDTWSFEDRIRALNLVRTAGYFGFWQMRLETAEIAKLGGRSVHEAGMFVAYVEMCDRHEVAPDELTGRVLRQFPPDGSGSLARRLRMMDAFVVPDALADVDDAADILDTYEPPLELPVFVETAVEDGQPDPLAEVRKLLPGGSGVRGRPPIVYTPTALDTELLPTLLTTPPTLVVLSGNAGDGKTAFIESVLEAAGVSYDAGKNEYEVDLAGRPYLVVLDGSEDSEDRSNTQLLAEALGKFGGASAVTVDRGTLIAVNKGRLLSFLETNQADFAYLWELARRRFVSGNEPLNAPYLLIDLNDRSVVAPDAEDSLAAGVLEKLVRWPGWIACESCDAVSACPVLFNIRTLASDDRARRQLWRVFAAVDLDDRVHITARHLVTKVASLIVSDNRCPDIRATVRQQGEFDQRSFFYNSIFSTQADGRGVDQAAIDRVTSAYDPSDIASPRADRQLAFHLVRGSLRLLVDDRDPDASRLLEEAISLETGSIEQGPAPGALEYRQVMIDLAAQVRRRLFFLDPGNELAPAFPLRSFDAYVELLHLGDQSVANQLEQLLVRLNSTLGINSTGATGLVVPRDYGQGLSGSGFALIIPSARFRVTAGNAVGTQYAQHPFMVSWPRSLLLVAESQDGVEVARLAIPILMFEILVRAAHGFRPISQTERSYMVRLQGFYRSLSSWNWGGGMSHVLYENGRILAKGGFGPDGNWLGAA
jgi:hypothetical protein